MPIKLSGFIPPNGKDCGSRSKTLSVNLDVVNEQQLEPALDCLLSDRVVSNVPGYGPGRWPETLAATLRPGELSGYLKRANPAQLPALLSHYGAVLAKMSPGSVPVEVFWTDSNGIAVHALLVALPGGGKPLIRAALFEEVLEE